MIQTFLCLLDALSQGHTLITPNNRLARQILDQWFKKNNSVAQVRPACLPYAAYIEQCYQKYIHQEPFKVHPILVSSSQQQHLWQKILFEQNLSPQAGLLDALNEAWRLCHLWGLDTHHSAFEKTPQTIQFQKLYQEFTAELSLRNAITAVELVPLLMKNLCWLPKQLTWVCFDEFTPQQRLLQAQLDQCQVPQNYFDLPLQNTTVHLVPVADEQTEYAALIQWLAVELKSLRPKDKIAIVIPDIRNARHHPLKTLLEQAFPDVKLNWSLGQPLTDYPLIAHALAVLKLSKERLDAHQWQLLLTSPYLVSAGSELISRAELLQKSPWSTERFVPLEALPLSLQAIEDYPERANLSDWIRHFKQRLSGLGFPGEHTLSSYVYQCLQRLMQLFDEFQSLAFITPVLSQAEALQSLTLLAQTTLFQPLNIKGPIEILGLLEASGCCFSSLWMLGMTDQCLPQKIKFNAWLPVELQREQLMPRTDPAREFIFAQRILQRLQNGCRQFVASYAQLKDEIHQSPCSLIQDCTPMSLTVSPKPMRSATFEIYTDSYSIPLEGHPQLRGGTAVLSLQAQCPFKAFAAFRLHAQSAPQVVSGLAPLKRGQLMHQLLHELWLNLKTQSNLISLSLAQKNRLIQTTLEKIIPTLRTPEFSVLLEQVEHQQQALRLLNILSYEQERKPFSTEALEQAYTLSLANLQFNVRIDRLDSYLNGDKCVIDYKSQLPTPLPWNDERPEHPQLLLYALLDEEITELLFIEIKAKGIQYRSFKVNTEQRETWEKRLALLAEELKQGYCIPEPKRPQICHRCEFVGLCRT